MSDEKNPSGKPSKSQSSNPIVSKPDRERDLADMLACVFQERDEPPEPPKIGQGAILNPTARYPDAFNIRFDKRYPDRTSKFISCRSRADEHAQMVELYDNSDGMAMVRRVGADFVASELLRYLEMFSVVKVCVSWRVIRRDADAVVTRWRGVYAINKDADTFQKIGFKTSPAEPCYFRLPFDIAEQDAFDAGLGAPWEPLKQAPFWASVLARTSNADALCHKIYSMFDERANRKQAVYIYGSADSGKSRISNAIANLLNARDPSGAALVHSPQPGGKVDKNWSAKLVGKRLLVYNEAPHKFMETAEFKAITGESLGMVRDMYVGWRQADLNMMIFFVSNEDPEVSSRPEILRRIIACHVSPFTDGRVMVEQQVDDEMQSEMPWFLAHCKMVYERTQIGARVASDTTELMEHVEEGMADDISLFHELFEQTGNIGDNLPRHVVREQLAMHGVREDRKFNRLKNIWLREGLLVKEERKEYSETGKRATVIKYVAISLRHKMTNPHLTGYSPGREK